MNRVRVISLAGAVTFAWGACASLLHGDTGDWRDITRSDALLDRASLEAIGKRTSLDTAERARLALALAHIDALRQNSPDRAQALTQLAGERARLADALGNDPRAGAVLLDIAQDALLSRLAEGTTDAECAIGIPSRKDLELALQLAREARVFIERAVTLLEGARPANEPASSDDALALDRDVRAPALDALALALLQDGAELQRLGLVDADALKPAEFLATTELTQRLHSLASDVGKLHSPLREGTQLALARFANTATREDSLTRLQRSNDPVLLAQVRAITLAATDLPRTSDLTPNALGLCSANASVRARLRGNAGPSRAIEAWKLLLDQAPAQFREALENAVLSRVSKRFAEALRGELASPFASALAGAALARDGDLDEALAALQLVKDDRTAMRIALPMLAQVAASQGDAAASANALFRFALAFPDDPRAFEGVHLAIEMAREAALPNLDAQLEGVSRVLGSSDDRTRWLAESIDLALDANDATLALRRADLLQALGGEARGEALVRRVEARALELLQLLRSNEAIPAARAEDLVREATQVSELLPRQSPLHARLAMAEAAALTALGRWADAAHRAEVACAESSLPRRVRSSALRVWLAAVVARGDRIEVPESAVLCLKNHRPLLDDVARALLIVVRESEARSRMGETDAARTAAMTRAVPLARLLVNDSLALASELSESMRVDAGRAFAAANEIDAALAMLTPIVDANRAGRDGTYAYALLLLRTPTKHARALECLKALAPLQADAVQRDEIWWLSQFTMIEFLANHGVPANGDAREEALPRLHRLRALDPTFGSPVAKRRFEALEKSLANGL